MKLLLLLASFCLSVVSVPRLAAADKSTKEVTPTAIDGTDAHVYRKLDPVSLSVFVYKPKNWSASDKRPALVYFFGGGWSHGTPEKSISQARWAASLGMVGIAPDYRTNGRFGTTPLESVADGRAALHWVEEHASELGVDPYRIVVCGSSAGGHVALWTAIENSPPGSDPAEAPTIKPAALILSSAVTDTSGLTGYTPKRFGDNAEALSPVHQMNKTMPPTLMFHGDADELVNFSTAVAFHEKMNSTGNDCELVAVPGGLHGFTKSNPEWKTKTREMMKTFLEKQGILPVTEKI